MILEGRHRRNSPTLALCSCWPKVSTGCIIHIPCWKRRSFAVQMQKYYIWIFMRYIGSGGTQTLPGLGGFTSATGIPPPRKSTVDYFIPNHQPITGSSVVHELLKCSEAATGEVGQKWVLNTFDLGVCLKALPIIWWWPEEFTTHVVTIGPFLTFMNYIGMITEHKMRGSGYT